MAIDVRKVDRRTVRAEIAVELVARNAEEAIFAARVQDGTIRIVRCIEGGLLVEAERIASALHNAAVRHIRQRTTPDGGSVA